MTRRKHAGLAFASLDFVICVALWALIQLTPPTPPLVSIPTPGEYAIVLTWPRSCDADVDMYVREPSGEIVYYAHLNGVAVHLEHDDIPADTNSGYDAGRNFERAVVRRSMPGEYTVNLHLYSTWNCNRPVRSVAELWKLTGRPTRVAVAAATLTGSGAERTAFRFSLRRNGDAYAVNRLQRRLVG